jgi:hypothetical protein
LRVCQPLSCLSRAAVTTFLDSRCPTVFHTTKPAPSTSGLLISADPREKPRRYDAKKAVAVKPVVDDLLKISEKTGIPFEISRAI